MSRKVIILDNEKGDKIAVIPRVIFAGKRSVDWNEVENYLKQYIGNIFEIESTKDMLYIGRDFADEYAHSVYTRKLKGALAKAKANLVQGVPELIEIADNKRWCEDFQHRHKKKAEKGWYRYNARFAIPVSNEDGEIVYYNIYKSVLIVRYASDGKLYLYDIQNIKKETSNPL